MNQTKSLKQILLEKGVKASDIGNHESDLYCKVCPEAVAAITEYENMIGVSTHKTTFINNITHELWYDIPFGFMPEHLHARLTNNL